MHAYSLDVHFWTELPCTRCRRAGERALLRQVCGGHHESSLNWPRRGAGPQRTFVSLAKASHGVPPRRRARHSRS
jgi:hypothetical protein